MTEVLRVTVKGTMPGGEVFSVNPVWNIGTDPLTATEAGTIATAIDAVTIPAALLAGIPASMAYVGTRVESRDSTGTLHAVGEHTRAAPVVGTASGGLPFQTAMVVSLRTLLAGASFRGRLYFPANGMTMTNTTLRPPTSSITAYLGGVKAYLALIETAIQATSGGATLVVWSRKTGGTALVTTLQAGDVLDVQRRRRDAVVESYSSSSWP